MSATLVTAPFYTFYDIDGSPLDAGYIYIGEANLDPIANPVTAYFDEAMTIPATQPIRTIGGYPARAGSPANLYIAEEDYSLLVRNKNNQKAFSVPSGSNISSSYFVQPGTGGVTSTLQERGENVVYVTDFGAVADGVTDDGPAINAATYYLYKTFGGGNVLFPPSDSPYYIATTLLPRTGVNWIGDGYVSYNATGVNAVVLKRATALTKMVYQSAYSWRVAGIEFEGNGGDVDASAIYCFAKTPASLPLPADDPLRPGTIYYPQGSGCALERCTFSNFWYAIGDTSSILSFNIRDCMFRSCRSAILNISDSRVMDSTFTGNKYAGLNLATGAVHVTGCMFEFNRTGTNLDEAANGIVIYNSANEIQIDGCRFDRNAGQDVYIYNGSKRPRDITIVGCHFMRAGWGIDAATRGAIYAVGTDRLTITANQFYAANSNPSASRGLVAPRFAVYANDNQQFICKGNQYGNLCRIMPLASSSGGSVNSFGVGAVWDLSGSGTGEYYLTDIYSSGADPYIGEPTAVVVNGAILTRGAVGTLSADEWDWGDTDTIGFDTLYVRITGDTDPGLEDIVAYYDNDPVVNQMNSSSATTRCVDFETDDFKDGVRYATAGRVLVQNNAVAQINANVLSVTIADGHGIVAGDTVYLADAVTVSVPTGLYVVDSVSDAGGGNDYINILRTAANAVGTIDLYTVSSATFVLRTRNRCMTYHVLPVAIRISADQATTVAKVMADLPLLIYRTSATALPTVTNGSISTLVGTLAINWQATSSSDNLNVKVESDFLGDELTVTVFNTTAYSIEYTATIPW